MLINPQPTVKPEIDQEKDPVPTPKYRPTNPEYKPMPTNNPVEVVKTEDITAGQALAALFSKLFSGGAVTNVILILALVGYVSYDQFVNKATPQPSPVPVPVVPVQKTLKDLVSPDAAPELASLYHQIANQLYTDKARVGKEGEGPVIPTIEVFYNFNNKASQGFNNMTGITGLAAIKSPIGERLKVATGTLNPAASLDDPTTNVRDRLIATAKQISEEFDERFKSVPLGTLQSF